MITVYVVPDEEAAAEVEQLRQLIATNDCQVLSPDNLKNDGTAEPLDVIEQCVSRCAVVVVLIKSDRPTELLRQALQLAKIAGKKIVGVWSTEPKSGTVPIEFEKYGSALVPWDPLRISAAVCKQKIEWSDATGTLRPEGQTARHRCRKKRHQHKNAAA